MAGFGLMALILGISFFVGYQEISRLNKTLGEIYNREFTAVEQAMKLKTSLYAVRTALLTIVIESDPERIEEKSVKLAVLSGEADASFKALERHFMDDPDMRSRLKEAARVWTAFKNTRDRQIIPAIRVGNIPLAGELATGIQQRRFEQFLSAILDVEAQTRAKADHVKVSRKLYEQLKVLYAVLSIMAIGLLAVMYALISKKVVSPLKHLVDVVQNMSHGHYDARVTVWGKGEIAELGQAFNGMADALAARTKDKDALLEKVTCAHQEWKNTFDNISDLVSIHDKDFNIIRYNAAFADHFGIGRDGVIEKKCHELFHGTDAPVEDCPHKRTMRDRCAATEEYPCVKSGKLFKITTSPHYSTSGDYTGSIHIARDITKERDRELRLVMSERLASVGQMASGLAHEINNPLAAIAGCAEGLLLKVKNDRYVPAQFEEYLGIIGEEVRRCKNITTGMLSFVRTSSSERKVVDMNELLDKTLEVIGFQGRLQEVAIARNYKTDLPAFHASDGELRQVFLAIIINALDAMKDRGTLFIETGAEGGSAFAKIRDSGPGISREQLTRIFDPFFTTKSDQGGTGLGLSIAHNIITNHGGAIEVDSEAGKGTTVTITVPMTDAVSPAS